MKTLLKVLGIIVALLVLVYMLGPRAASPQMDVSIPEVPGALEALEASVVEHEKQLPLKPDNEARILWADSAYQKTEYCLVYLPGFTATYMEGDPLHRMFAERYGCNLYLARLHGHGLITDNPLIDFSADSLMASASRALAIGRQLGDKVILMSTSTGSTLSIVLAALFPEQIDALITYSPNIRIADPSAVMLSKPWGLQIARAVVGDKFRSYEASDSFQQYWYTRYRLEGLAGLQRMVESTMTASTFKQVDQPFFLGYYYKDEENQDEVVSVPAMLKMYEELGTAATLKRKVAFANVENHALASGIVSNDIPEVCKETFRFAEEVLGLTPQTDTTEVAQ
jgi:pimeloyl-ACP methyl ester carboxylesterase